MLVSYYVNDANSARAQVLIHATPGALAFTGLHRLEMRNALELGVFRRLLTAAQARATWKSIEQDFQAARLFPTPVNWVPVFRTAAQWVVRHTASVGCRSLDVLHVAAARKLAATEFLSSDGRQRSLAQLLGFVVKP